MALLADDIFALQDLAGWARRHGIHQVRSALEHCLKEAEHAPDNVSLAESMEHALVVDAAEPTDEIVGDDSGSGDGHQGEEQQPGTDTETLMPPPAETEPTTAPPAEEPPAPPAASTSKRKRATYPKGHDKAGEFIPDDPSTPENEAFVQN